VPSYLGHYRSTIWDSRENGKVFILQELQSDLLIKKRNAKTAQRNQLLTKLGLGEFTTDTYDVDNKIRVGAKQAAWVNEILDNVGDRLRPLLAADFGKEGTVTENWKIDSPWSTTFAQPAFPRCRWRPTGKIL
jgi:hypothetical protein